MKKWIPFLCVLLMLSITHDALAQRRITTKRFNAGFVLGLNFSQIDGDDQFGYRKPGICVGLSGMARLSKRTELVIELLFSERGASPDSDFNAQNKKARNIHLSYAEVPLLFHYKSAKNNAGFYTVKLEGGFYFSRLLRTQIEERFLGGLSPTDVRLSDYQNQFNSDEIGFLLGGGYYFSPHFGVNFRHFMAFNRLLDERVDLDNQSVDLKLRSYFLQLQMVYLL
ncbi:MAG TPA: porin family protein [Saprospiraceae bacterium]|nr:porin family protein [Saprospiraceae bacterium]HMQ84757.1 porin family protein [Saprospiraceae bacterium]